MCPVRDGDGLERARDAGVVAVWQNRHAEEGDGVVGRGDAHVVEAVGRGCDGLLFEVRRQSHPVPVNELEKTILRLTRQYSPRPQEETEPTVKSDYCPLNMIETVQNILITLAPAAVALRTNV